MSMYERCAAIRSINGAGDDVPDAERGRQHLGQGADIDDNPRGIGASKRNDGPTVVVKLVIEKAMRAARSRARR
jgi:hypothetical protein